MKTAYFNSSIFLRDHFNALKSNLLTTICVADSNIEIDLNKREKDRVREKELKSLIKGLQQEFNGHNVKLAYIIVTKRLSDRFFTKSGNYFNNPEGGLIVDTHVVKDNTFEYFMVAQAVNQGTATPTNYNVIFNNTDLKAETFYELTYNQCYSYYNWSGPLKVPAVIMMANKVADLIGQTHSRDAMDTVESLKDSLFFL